MNVTGNEKILTLTGSEKLWIKHQNNFFVTHATIQYVIVEHAEVWWTRFARRMVVCSRKTKPHVMDICPLTINALSRPIRAIMRKPMNISEATKKFCEVAGINPESKAGDIVCKMIGIETDWEHSYRNKKIPYDDCVDIAYRRMINWYENALDYHFTDASELVASHRRACAWTILFARGL